MHSCTQAHHPHLQHTPYHAPTIRSTSTIQPHINNAHVPSSQENALAAGYAVGNSVAYLAPHLSGAIDIMAVRQPDGSCRCSPFYGAPAASLLHRWPLCCAAEVVTCTRTLQLSHFSPTLQPTAPPTSDLRTHTTARLPHHPFSALWKVHGHAQPGQDGPDKRQRWVMIACRFFFPMPASCFVHEAHMTFYVSLKSPPPAPKSTPDTHARTCA